jgi:hypothetical protein
MSENITRTKQMTYQGDITMPPAELFTLAAWAHAKSFMEEHGYVPDVMILGRYEDEQLMFVFPSSQDKEAFAQACAQEATAFNADIALLVGEAVWLSEETAADHPDGTPIVKVLTRERNQPIRAQVAHIAEAQPGKRIYGPVSGIPGTHSQEILDAIWPGVVH